MDRFLYEDAQRIISSSLKAVVPDAAVAREDNFDRRSLRHVSLDTF